MKILGIHYLNYRKEDYLFEKKNNTITPASCGQLVLSRFLLVAFGFLHVKNVTILPSAKPQVAIHAYVRLTGAIRTCA